MIETKAPANMEEHHEAQDILMLLVNGPHDGFLDLIARTAQSSSCTIQKQQYIVIVMNLQPGIIPKVTPGLTILLNCVR